MKHSSSRTSSGFTLVELLVAITITIVLAALTVVGLSRMRAAGDTATAVRNIRQLQVANVSYATEHDGRYASYFILDEDGKKNYWYRDLAFLAELTGDNSQLTSADPNKDVPSSLLDPTAYRAKKKSYDLLSGSYGMVHDFMIKRSDQDTERYTTINEITNPSRTAAFLTTTDLSARYESRNLWWSEPVEGKTTNGKTAFRHGNKAIAVYFDGSTGLISREDINRFDANGGKKNVFWNGLFKVP
jgi:prepilin-type processing-associated H-X9-DG protein